MIKTADHIIDLGAEGGDAGGYVVGVGTPEEIMKLPSRTPVDFSTTISRQTASNE